MDRSVFESCEEDADELFNHLEELLRGKDAMGKRVAGSRRRELLAKSLSVNVRCSGSRRSLKP